MFYSADILSAPKRGLGIVWLAATLGAKSTVRKLSKRDIAACDISKTCDSVKDPAEPMALRLSSQLLYGVVRIYVQQAEQWFGDVQTTHAALRRALTFMVTAPAAPGAAPGARGALDMPVVRRTGGGGTDAITLSANTAFFAGDFDIDWAWEGDVVADESSGIGSAFIAGATSAGLPSAPGSEAAPSPRRRHTADKENITLRRERFGDFEDDAEGSELGLGPRESMRDDLLNVGDDEMQLDLGLEDVLPGVPLEQGIEEEGRRRVPGRDSSALGFGDMPGDMPDYDEMPGGDFGFGDGDGFDLALHEAPPGTTEPVAQGTPSRSSLKRTPSLGPEGDDSGIGVGAAPAKKPKKVAFAREDTSLVLSDAEMQRNRKDYVEIMRRARAAEEKRMRERQDDIAAKGIVFGPGSDIGGAPQLASIWGLVVSGRVNEIEQFYANMRIGGAPAAAAAAVAASPAERARQDAPVPERMDVDEPAMGFDFFGQDDMPQMEDMPDLIGFGDAPAADVSGSDGAPEVGRGSGSEATVRAALPWNVAAEATRTLDDTGLGDRESRAGDGTMRSFSEGDITGLRGRERRGSSMIPDSPGARRESAAREASVLHESRRDDPTGFESQLIAEALEGEQQNFLLYARKMAEEVAPEALFFSDLAPVADSMPHVAAQAFYHLLSLATNDRIAVAQTDAYGEILVQLKA